MNKHTAILVADAARARLFSYNRQDQELTEVHDLSHTQSRLRERDLNSDRPGRVAGGGGSRHGIEPAQSGVRHEAEIFARELATLLENERREGRFDRLVLMASPKFLGELRQHLGKPCANLVTDTVAKDLVAATAEDILAHLPASKSS